MCILQYYKIYYLLLLTGVSHGIAVQSNQLLNKNALTSAYIIHVRDINITTSRANISLYDITCYNINYGNIVSAYNTIFSISNTSLSCNSSFLLNYNLNNKSHTNVGFFNFSLLESELSIEINKYHDKKCIVLSNVSSTCSSKISMTNIYIEDGSILVKELLRTILEIEVPLLLNSELCKLVEKIINIINNITCQSAGPNSTEPWATTAHLGIVISMCSATFISFLIVIVCIIQRQRDVVIYTDSKVLYDDPSKPLLEHLHISNKSNNIQFSNIDSDILSLSNDTSIHIGWRIIIPISLVFTIALFISSNTNVGATVALVATIGNITSGEINIFEFSLANSVSDMWSAGVYPLSLLIAVFSGAWPYLKLCLMLFCWTMPTRLISCERRKHILMWLDTLGKWSLIDMFVLVLMMVAFRLHLPFTENNNVSVDVIVISGWGIYGFIIATMMSLCISRIMITINHNLENPHEGHIESSKCVSLLEYSFQLQSNGPCCTGLNKLICICILLCSTGMVIFSCVIHIFVFEFKGLVGLLHSYLSGIVETSYSIISLGMDILNSTLLDDSNKIGVRFIQAFFIIITCILPALNLILLFILLSLPLKLQMQRCLFIVIDILSAWSCLDIFVVSVIAAVLEIEKFSQFIIGDKCDFLNSALAKLNPLLNGDDKCFDVIANLNRGCWIMFGTCVFYMLITSILMRYCRHILEERLTIV